MTARPVVAGALLLGLSGAFSHAQERLPRPPCLSPVAYRIGALDPRFGISQADFTQAVEKAAKAWEDAAGRQLFRFDKRGALEVDLVYDDRQETAQRLHAVRASIAEKLNAADAIRDQLRPLQDKLHALDKAYGDRLSSYQRSEEAYNQSVAEWNRKGGAPEGAYQQLTGQKFVLRRQADSLQADRNAVNRLADEVNVLANKHNALLRSANAESDAFQESNPGLAFEQGHYLRQGRDARIDIYEYDGETALLAVLAHELGHALGIRHNGNPSSIMSALIHVERFALTAEDIEGLKAACALR